MKFSIMIKILFSLYIGLITKHTGIRIENLNLNKNIKVLNIDWLNNAYFDRSNYNLVLLCPLPLGKILNDDIILQNYQIMEKEIGRIGQIHIINGKRLKKVIKEIISKGDLNLPELTKEEYLFYDKVKNRIYEIIEII